MFNLKIESASAYVTWAENYFREETLKMGMRALQFFALHNRPTREFWYRFGLNVLHPATIEGFADYMQAVKLNVDHYTLCGEGIEEDGTLNPFDTLFPEDKEVCWNRDEIWGRIVPSDNNPCTYAMNIYIKTIGTMLFLKMFEGVDFNETMVYDIEKNPSIKRVVVDSYSSEGCRSIVVGFPEGIGRMKKFTVQDWVLYFKTLAYLLICNIGQVERFFKNKLPEVYIAGLQSKVLSNDGMIYITKDLVPTMLNKPIPEKGKIAVEGYYAKDLMHALKNIEAFAPEHEIKSWNGGWREKNGHASSYSVDKMTEVCLEDTHNYREAYAYVDEKSLKVRPGSDYDLDNATALLKGDELLEAFDHYVDNKVDTLAEDEWTGSTDVYYDDKELNSEFDARYLLYKLYEYSTLKALRDKKRELLPEPADVEYWTDKASFFKLNFRVRAYVRLWTFKELKKAQNDAHWRKWLSTMFEANGDLVDSFKGVPFEDEEIPFRDPEQMKATTDIYVLFSASSKCDKKWNMGVLSMEQSDIEVLKGLLDRVYRYWTPTVVEDERAIALNKREEFKNLPYWATELGWYEWADFISIYVDEYMQEKDVHPYLTKYWGLTHAELYVLRWVSNVIDNVCWTNGIDFSLEVKNNIVYSILNSLRDVSEKRKDEYFYDFETVKQYIDILRNAITENPDAFVESEGMIAIKPLSDDNTGESTFQSKKTDTDKAGHVTETNTAVETKTKESGFNKPLKSVKLSNVLRAEDRGNKFKNMFTTNVLENVVIRGKLDTFLNLVDHLVEYKKGSALVKDFEGESLLVIPYAKFDMEVSEIVSYDELDFIDLHNIYYELDPTIKEDAFEKLCIVCKNTTAKEIE